MAYKLKGGEYVNHGKLYGWTGKTCPNCKGCGVCNCVSGFEEMTCRFCGGTGEEHGLMPKQPADLPSDTE